VRAHQCPPKRRNATTARAERAAPGAPLMPCSPALSWRRYQGLIKDVNAKIDRLKNLSASAASDQDAWNSTVAAVRRDVEDADEVLGKFAMEARRFTLLRTLSVCPRLHAHMRPLPVCAGVADAHPDLCPALTHASSCQQHEGRLKSCHASKSQAIQTRPGREQGNRGQSHSQGSRGHPRHLMEHGVEVWDCIRASVALKNIGGWAPRMHAQMSDICIKHRGTVRMLAALIRETQYMREKQYMSPEPTAGTDSSDGRNLNLCPHPFMCKHASDESVFACHCVASSSCGEQRQEASDRTELLTGGSHDGGGFRGELTLSNDHRTRLSNASDRMAAGSDKLKESRKIARETEMIAVDVMEDLRQQVRPWPCVDVCRFDNPCVQGACASAASG